MRVRRPGVNQPKQLRESVISPNSNPGGRRAGEGPGAGVLAVRESVSAPRLAAFQVPHGCCHQGSRHHIWPDYVQRKTGPADTRICFSGNCSWKPQGASPSCLMGPSPTSEPVPDRRHKMAQLGSIHWPLPEAGQGSA